MPFPHAKISPTSNEHVLVAEHDTAIDLMAKVNALADRFGINTAPRRSAIVVYLGLCRLKHFSSEKNIKDGRELCVKLLNSFSQPTAEGRQSINCSYVQGERKDGKINHELGIKRACDKYLPQVKSRKKRCLMLLALGAEHAELDDAVLPGDDRWVENFQF